MANNYFIKMIWVVCFAYLLQACNGKVKIIEYQPFGMNLNVNWKFILGNDSIYKDIHYDDNSWGTISMMDYWNNQGYRNYNGHAWYRLKFTLPDKTLFKFSANDSVILFIGLINDYYQSYLNGKLLANENDYYESNENMERVNDPKHRYHVRNECKYIISIKDERLVWGESNTIALHVLNMANNGGFHSDFPPHLAIVRERNYLEFNKNNFYSVIKNTYQDSELVLKNNSTKLIVGDLIVSTINSVNSNVYYKHTTNDINISPDSLYKITVSLPRSFEPISIKFEFLDYLNRKIQKDSVKLPYVLNN